MPSPANLRKPAIIVTHAKLERWNDESAYKSKCPACTKGILLVRRHPETYELLNLDNCVSCGQAFVYDDKLIGGEPVRDVMDIQPVQEAMKAAEEDRKNRMN